MVDVGEKPATRRRAVAVGRLRMADATRQALQDKGSPKGDVLGVARVAGIQAGKDTSRWIPLCHPLPLDVLSIEFAWVDDHLEVRAEAATTARTGVEMEALTAVSGALLTVYDMCKAVDRSLEISSVHLLEKEGGRSGRWEWPGK